MFLANYGDTLTDAPLPAMIDTAEESDKIGQLPRVRPNYTFHVVVDGRRPGRRRHPRHDATPTSGSTAATSSSAARSSTTSAPGEDLVEEPFQRLIAREQALGYRHEGFWAPMDTLKDKQWLESLHESGAALGRSGTPSRTPSCDARSQPPPDAAARARPPEDAPLRRARPRRPLRRHRDRLRRHDPQAASSGAVSAVYWVVLSAPATRADEARASAEAFLAGARQPRSSSRTSATASSPTTARRSRTSSRRSRPTSARPHPHPPASRPPPGPPLDCELTWNTFRDHLILEYEVPKYDGDMGRRTCSSRSTRRSAGARSTTCCEHFGIAASTSAGSPRTCSRA